LSSLISIGIFILILAIVYTPMFGLHYLIKSFVKRLNYSAKVTNIKGVDVRYVNDLLIKHNPYFKGLNNENRNKFLGRLYKFLV
jgi:hypothetical protein